MIGLWVGAILAGISAAFVLSFLPFIVFVIAGAILSVVMGNFQGQPALDIFVSGVVIVCATQFGYAAGLTIRAVAKTSNSSRSSRSGENRSVLTVSKPVASDKKMV